MPRPIPAKQRPATIAVICNLTELHSAEQRNYGVYPIFPILAGIQYVVRCVASLDRQRAGKSKKELEELDRRTKVLTGGGARKEIIAECALGEEYALTEIADAVAPRQEMGGPDGHDNTKVLEKVEAYEIADDVVRSINRNMAIGGVGANQIEGFAGVFVCDEERPTEQELKVMRDRLRTCDEKMVERADTDFAFYKNPMFCVEAIPSAKRLKIEDREWLSVYKPTKECPACFVKLDPRAVVCKSCQFVIDRKAAIAMGYLEPVDESGKAPAAKSV